MLNSDVGRLQERGGIAGESADILADDDLRGVVGRQNVVRVPIDDAEGVPELFWLVLTTVMAWMRPRHDLVLENLLLRHQLTVLTRPTRARPRAGLRICDKLLWILARRFCADWRGHLEVALRRR